MINASANRPGRIEIVRNWLPRYTGMPLDKFGDYILLKLAAPVYRHAVGQIR